MNHQIAQLSLRVRDLDPQRRAYARQHAAIADLAARLGIERRLVEHHRPLRPCSGPLQDAAGDQPDDLAFRRLGRVAEEVRRSQPVAQLEPGPLRRRLARPRPCRPRARPLFGHRALEPGHVHRTAAVAQRVLRQIQRKPVRVVEPERDLARQHAVFAQPPGLVGEQRQPAFQQRLEPLLLQPRRFADQRFRLAQLRIGAAHLPDQRRQQLEEARLARAHHVQMAHRAPHDPAQHVATSVARRQYSVGDQEGGAPDVIGHHPMAHPERSVRRLPRHLRTRPDQRPERVRVVIVGDPLQDRRDPFQAHARVDRRPGQGRSRSRRILVVLHEDQVPDLDEPVPILPEASRRTAGDVLSVVVEDFRARPARPRVAHAPEIVGRRDANDPPVVEPRDPAPQRSRFLVLVIDRHQQPRRIEPELARDQVPRQLDRQRLEIVAEREIAEHLEERVMPRRVSDIVEVVVLAARPHHLLRRRRPRIWTALLAGEHVLELHHSGIGEQQRRIVARHQRRARHHCVAGTREIVDEPGSDVVAAGHESLYRTGGRW